MSKLYFLPLIILLAACSSKPEVVDIPILETKTIEIKRPAPIVPKPDQLTLREVQWEVITAENAAEKLEKNPAYFGLTEAGYKALSLNVSDLRAYIEQQKAIIKKYRDSYK